MTIKELLEGIQRIRNIADDDESAHASEDRLRHNVLESIANGTAEDPKEMARLTLSTSDIEFSRWYS